MFIFLTFVSLIPTLISLTPGAGVLKTRGILEGIHSESDRREELSGRTTNTRCSSKLGHIETPDMKEDNFFLDMANYLEYVQMSNLQLTSRVREDAIKYFNVSTAAFTFGNYLVAQESFARALTALEVYNSRKKRAARSNYDAPRGPSDIISPEDLFTEFKHTMGTRKFNQLLHLRRKVTMAFVIDTSSSMENDRGNVIQYINQLLVEQERSQADAVYVVLTFADPAVGPVMTFDNKKQLMEYIKNLEVRVGGDCEEKTCIGITRAMYNYNFLRKGNAAMYIFTDAGSKDCGRHANNIIRTFQFCKASAFFVLFDSCQKNIDKDYVKIAQGTGGFCLLVRDRAVYNITDTVNGAFESDALVCGEDIYKSGSKIGQGSGPYAISNRAKRDAENRPRQSQRKEIPIDDMIGHFKVTVSIEPPALVGDVRLSKPLGGDRALCSQDNLQYSKSVAENGVVFDVKAIGCPCVGNWTLSYPADPDSFSFSVKSMGDFIISFEAYFVDELGGTRVANYNPCLNIEEYLVVKINQGSQTVKESLQIKIVGLTGNYIHLTEKLAPDESYKNTYIVKLRLPNDIGTGGFKVVLEGEVKEGTWFTRVSSNIFYPTLSCLRIYEVSNYYALFPRRKTYIRLQLTNGNEIDDVYHVYCTNTENYPIVVGNPKLKNESGGSRSRPVFVQSNPVLVPMGYKAYYQVALSAPNNLLRGRTVVVTCTASSGTEEIIEMIRVTEMDENFYN